MPVAAPRNSKYDVDVALVTCRDHPNLPHDDAILVDALNAQNLSIRPVIWDETTADCSARAIVIRAAWDSHLDPPKFLAWLAKAAATGAVVNGAQTIAWNFDKRYLIDLAAMGHATVETRLIESPNVAQISQAISDLNCPDLVMKPRFGASAFGAKRLARTDRIGAIASHFEKFGNYGGLLLQPFVPSVEDERERSLVFIDGRFSHSLYRTAFGRAPTLQTSENVHFPTTAELNYCAALLGDFGHTLAYARVDLVPIDGSPNLMELELIDPSLFFATKPESATWLANRIARIVLESFQLEVPDKKFDRC